ncbi:MAG: phosphatidate cytidylyltransferase [Dehalococcoidales bacterium]|nr:phosphatidate cytidylyltransferase [Dehalococcoidales bacterium]
MLKKRIITSLWGIPLLTAITWFGEPLFTILLVVWGALAVFEFYRPVTATRGSPLTYFGLVWTALFIASRNSQVISFLQPRFSESQLAPLLITLAVILPLIWRLLRPRKVEAFASWVWTIAGILYIGWLLGYIVALRDLDGNRTWQSWVFFAFFTTFASDTAAFFTGRAWGRHKLAPNISPGKTREGAIGGLLGAIIFSLFFILPTPLRLPMNWGQTILLGGLVSIFGQLGDLVESLFKRNMGVKDSGNLLPGHGGVLDRIDSIIFAGIVVYYYVIWVIP